MREAGSEMREVGSLMSATGSLMRGADSFVRKVISVSFASFSFGESVGFS